MAKKWINTREACQRTGLSLSWFEKHRRELPCYRVGRVYLYDQDELDDWIESHRVTKNQDDMKKLIEEVVHKISKGGDK